MLRKLTTCLVLAACIALLHVEASACSCDWAGPFVDVAGKADLVVTVRVDGYGRRLRFGQDIYTFMRVTVLDVLAGTEQASVLKIYGDTGALCRPYIAPETFALGAEYVLAIHRLEDARAGEYEVISCGEFWLPRRADTVSGRIRSSGAETMSYSDFVSIFANRKSSVEQ